MTTSFYARTTRQQALLKTVLAILAASALPTARAARDCWIDSFGRRHCRLSLGARIAIAVSISVAFLLLIIAIAFTRRRRIARANQSYVASQQHLQAHQPYGNQYGNNPYPPYDPSYAAQYQQYPPPGQGYMNQQGGYTPPQGPPPSQQPPHYQEFSAPQSPPPAAKA